MPLPEIHYDPWFHKPHPHDSMPIATDKTIEDSMHEKMYQIATSKYNPFAVGGSESIHDFEGGSENVQR